MVASLVGNLTSSFEAVPQSRLFYRHIELCKTESLMRNQYDFDAPCCISEMAKREIQWWIDNIEDSFAYIKATPDIDYKIHTDASTLGWGACDNSEISNGRWSEEEQEMHINCLELLAIKFALMSFVPLHPHIKGILTRFRFSNSF